WATFFRRYAAMYPGDSETLVRQLVDRAAEVALDGGAVGGVEAHFQDVLLDGFEVLDFQSDRSGIGGESGFFDVEGVVALGFGVGGFVVAGAVGAGGLVLPGFEGVGAVVVGGLGVEGDGEGD